jgi:hypothetical protein
MVVDSNVELKDDSVGYTSCNRHEHKLIQLLKKSGVVRVCGDANFYSSDPKKVFNLSYHEMEHERVILRTPLNLYV